jgi:CheY-like chemotaxis protein
MQPGLHALLVCSDDIVVRLLRRVLSDLEIDVEHCTDVDTGSKKFMRQRFDAVILDSTAGEVAKILKGIKSAPVNNRAMAVAIIDGQSDAKSLFEVGAHIVLFKPLSLERTKASFRSLRALIKRERRIQARIPVEIPVKVQLENGNCILQVYTSDLSESGMAVKGKIQLPSSFGVEFDLPEGAGQIQCRGEVAWEGNSLQGVHFLDLRPELTSRLKSWIERQLLGEDAEDPPVICMLTDLSANACYLKTEFPFPIRTRLRIKLRIHEADLQVRGLVRVMHPGLGMGVELSRAYEEAANVEPLIQTLASKHIFHEVEVLPDCIDNSPETFEEQGSDSEKYDRLFSLFRSGMELMPDDFHAELRKQREQQIVFWVSNSDSETRTTERLPLDTPLSQSQ